MSRHFSRAATIAAAVALAAIVAACGHQTVATPSASPRVSAPQPSPATASATATPASGGLLGGDLLIADRGNSRLLLVDSMGRIVWRYPSAASGPSAALSADDAFFGPGFDSISANEEFRQTIRLISFPGSKVTWLYGHRDVAGSGPGYLDRPDDAYLLPNGLRTVADIANCRVLFIAADGRIVRSYGRAGVCAHDPPRLLGSPNGATPLPDGGTLITEIAGSWVDRIAADGSLLWSVHLPVAYPSDAQLIGGSRILLADYSAPGQVLMTDLRGRVLWRYGPASGPGALNHPSLALMLPNGLIAVTDDYRHRVLLIDPSTRRIVWRYGRTDVAGSAGGLLNTPDGLDFLPYQALAGDPALRRLITD